MHKLNYLSHNWLAFYIQNKLVEKNLHLANGITLDLGCGEMPYMNEYAKFCSQYIGVDWPSSLHSFKANIAANLNTTLPIKNLTADTIVCLEVLEHIANPWALLTECSRVLRPDGKLILSVPFQWREHEQPHDYYRYTQYGLEYILKTAGFSHIEITAKSGLWTCIALKINYHFLRITNKPILGKVIRIGLAPIWIFNQLTALLLDKIWPGDSESIGYFVTATKS